MQFLMSLIATEKDLQEKNLKNDHWIHNVAIGKQESQTGLTYAIVRCMNSISIMQFKVIVSFTDPYFTWLPLILNYNRREDTFCVVDHQSIEYVLCL